MFRLIKIVFNACLLVLAIIGFNAIGGQKYVESAKNAIVNFVQERAMENAKKIGDFSGIHEEFQIDNTVNYLRRLEAAKHKGPVIIITKGDYSQFPDVKFDLHMLANIGLPYTKENVSDTMFYIRYAHDALTPANGGPPLGLKDTLYLFAVQTA